MFVELVDHLRCPEPHEDSWLVLRADVTHERHVLRGTLACPACGRRFDVRDGVAHLHASPLGDGPRDGNAADAPSRDASQPNAESDAPGPRSDLDAMRQQSHPDASRPRSGPDAPGEESEWPIRLAAYLDLGEGRGAVGLYGTWVRHASALAAVAESVDLLAIAPVGRTQPMLSALVPPSRDRIPLADGALRAVAVDAAGDTADAASLVVAGAARLLRPGGRLLAPAAAEVPHGVRELARDAEWWVGERDAAPAGIVAIGSRRR